MGSSGFQKQSRGDSRLAEADYQYILVGDFHMVRVELRSTGRTLRLRSGQA